MHLSGSVGGVLWSTQIKAEMVHLKEQGLFLKWITNKGLLYSVRNSAKCYVAAWMGGEFGREYEIHVHVWLSPFASHLKLSHNIVN